MSWDWTFSPKGRSEFTKRLNLLEFGSQVEWERYRLLAGRSSEGITNLQLSINCLAVVKIFGIERRASSFQRSGNDQRVIDVVSVLLRNLECRVMHFKGDGERRRAENSKSI